MRKRIMAPTRCLASLLLLLVLLPGCDKYHSGTVGKRVTLPTHPRATAPVKMTARADLAPQNWAYWLQDADPAQLAASAVDLVVMDYSQDGTDSRAYTRQEIRSIQRTGKTVLGYFSIGEAESYRFYWDHTWKDAPPPFLGPENPDWPENFKVRFWYEAWWQTALQPYLDRIIAQGFDGVYLDIVDAYWYWYEAHGKPLRTMANEMVALVMRIARYGRERTGNQFIVCPQNGLGLIEAASEQQATRFMRAIDMVGVESLLYNTTEADSIYRQSLLSRFAAEGKPVMLIEYVGQEALPVLRQRVASLPFPVVLYRAAPDAALDSLEPQ